MAWVSHFSEHATVVVYAFSPTLLMLRIVQKSCTTLDIRHWTEGSNTIVTKLDSADHGAHWTHCTAHSSTCKSHQMTASTGRQNLWLLRCHLSGTASARVTVIHCMSTCLETPTSLCGHWGSIARPSRLFWVVIALENAAWLLYFLTNWRNVWCSQYTTYFPVRWQITPHSICF